MHGPMQTHSKYRRKLICFIKGLIVWKTLYQAEPNVEESCCKTTTAFGLFIFSSEELAKTVACGIWLLYFMCVLKCVL